MKTGDDLYLEETRAEFRRYQNLAERALEQIDDSAFLAVDPATGDGPATIVKHVAGNLQSRWRDFLTSDGEKPDRDRDGEFVLEREETRADLMAQWSAAWRTLHTTLDMLTAADLGHMVTIRGEPHTVVRAAQRSLAHTSYHVGQIVLLAKRAAGAGWRTLSIPRGGSQEFNRSMKLRAQDPTS